jgi:hypothetical protein
LPEGRRETELADLRLNEKEAQAFQNKFGGEYCSHLFVKKPVVVGLLEFHQAHHFTIKISVEEGINFAHFLAVHCHISPLRFFGFPSLLFCLETVSARFSPPFIQ